MSHHSAVKILDSAIGPAPEYGAKHKPLKISKRSFHAYGNTSAGAGTVTVAIRGSNIDNPDENSDADWITIGTITIVLGVTRTSDGFTTDAPWKFIQAKITNIAGTDANVTVYMGG